METPWIYTVDAAIEPLEDELRRAKKMVAEMEELLRDLRAFKAKGGIAMANFVDEQRRKR